MTLEAMIRFSIILTLALVVPWVGGQATKPTGQFFNCHHKGQEQLCRPGNCSANGTTCDCGDPNVLVSVQGTNCVPVEDAQPCSKRTCHGNGTCLKNRNDQEICYCDQLYAGPDCLIPRVVVTCTAANMTVQVRPHGDFTGVMVANRFHAEDDCRLTEDAAGTWQGTFSLLANQNNSCGVAKVPGEAGQEFKVTVRVLYNAGPDIYLATDQLLALTCFFNQNVSVASKVSSVDASDGNLSPGTGQGVAVPLDFEVRAGGEVLGELAEVEVGELLTLAVRLLNNQAYHKLLVEDCTASNQPEDDDSDAAPVTLPIVTDGCPVNHSVIAGNHRALQSAGGQPEVEMDVRAFVFVAGSVNFTNALYLSCDVRLCQNDSSECDPPTCPADRQYRQGLGRRRRAVREEEMVRVGQTLRVRFGDRSLDSQLGEDGRGGVGEGCAGQPDRTLLAVVGVMGVGMVALLTALLIILVLWRRRSTRGKGEGEDFSTTSSTSTLHLHLPRPRLQ